MTDSTRGSGEVEWVDKGAFVMPLVPPELSFDPVVLGLVHAVAFLELSDDSAVDPDWAVEALEHIAHYLQRLSPDRVQPLSEELSRLSSWAIESGQSPRLVDLCSKLLEHCGVGETRE